MAKVSANYESVVVISTTLGEDGIKAMVEKITNLISQNGTLDSVNEWGKRRLAYPINDETEGYYVLFNFTSVPSFPAELDRIYKITEGLLRSLIVAKD
ncbi:MAG: 30S ribosomal protein S6 [Clostridiales bacterium]|nr:30S ribosomal protein S6 [Clostridiales bacterium]